MKNRILTVALALVLVLAMSVGALAAKPRHFFDGNGTDFDAKEPVVLVVKGYMAIQLEKLTLNLEKLDKSLYTCVNDPTGKVTTITILPEAFEDEGPNPHAVVAEFDKCTASATFQVK